VSTKRIVQDRDTSCFRGCTFLALVFFATVIALMGLMLFGLSRITFDEFKDIRADMRRLYQAVSTLGEVDPNVWQNLVNRVRDLEDFRERLQGLGRLKE
jgi:hypothetical protein